MKIQEFLTAFREGGSWVLTAIIPDGDTYTQTFTCPDRAAAWAEAQTGQGRNLYFHVNPTKTPLTKKAAKTDISAVEYLHVDIDPRDGGDRDTERERIRGLLTTFRPEPTIVLDSGNGYQAFWRLETPEPLGGDADIERMERYNRQLAHLLGGDNCHNIDRLMRLPGTTNYPDAKKRAKGRVPAQAGVVRHNPEAIYPLTHFTPAPSDVGRNPAKTTQAASAPVDWAKVQDVGTEALQGWAKASGKTVKESTLAIIATGTDPVEGEHFPSRSEAVFRVCCDLIRAGVPDEMILGVITGDNVIAESVKGAKNPRQYAQRQVDRAKEAVAEEAARPELAEMNSKHFVVLDYGGKTAVMTKVYDPDSERDKLVTKSFEAVKQYYANRSVEVLDAEGKVKYVPLFDWWNKHPNRRQCDSIFFDPGKRGEGREVPGHHNLWRGWDVEPIPGDWSALREHIREVLADGNPEYDAYILRWAAWAVQNPDEPAEVALVFRGGKGTGKGVFARSLKNLFGRHGLQVTDPNQVTGRFNEHFRDCCLLFADEAVKPGIGGGEAQLKGMITEPTLAVEGKGKDLMSVRNRLHVVMASNERWIVPATEGERRFAVFDVSDVHQKEEAYFSRLYAQIADGGLAAMLHDLLAMDLGGFHPRYGIPDTEALKDQKGGNLDPVQAFVFDYLKAGTYPDGMDDDGDWVNFRLLTSSFLQANPRYMGGRDSLFRDNYLVRSATITVAG